MNKEILKLAIPNVISNLSIPLLSTVDTLLMGQLSALHLAAVGISGMIFNLFYWNFGFLRMGTTGMTAQAYGAKDQQAYSLILYRALFLGLIISIVLLAGQTYLLEGASYFMNIEDSYFDLVKRYFSIRILAAPATMGLYALLGWYFGMQNAVIPMVITIIVNIINIILSLYLVNNHQMAIDGVAWGTVVAQYVGLVIGILFLWKYKTKLVRVDPKKILNYSGLKGFLNVNKDIFIRTIGLTFIFSFFYSQSAKQGATTLAVMVVLLQFLNWMSYFIDGFAYASESLVGKYYGAKNNNKLKKAIRYSFIWGAILAIIFSILYYIGGDYILKLFTTDIEVVTAANQLMKWTILMPIAAFMAYIWDGVFIGLTAVRAMRNSMFISLIIYLVLFYTIPYTSMDWYWIVFLIFLLSRGIVQTIQYYHYIKPKYGIE